MTHKINCACRYCFARRQERDRELALADVITRELQQSRAARNKSVDND